MEVIVGLLALRKGDKSVLSLHEVYLFTYTCEPPLVAAGSPPSD